MKKFLTSLPLFVLLYPAFADNFNATDKVLYFNSDVLIDVIKRTFPEDLQLNVAQEYVDLIDENGNVSIQDLMAVCHAGKLEVTKCRNFIQDLINTSGADIKPFYWADYISTGFNGGLNIYNSGDGYFHDNANLGDGEWAIQFGWIKGNSFKKLYPDTKYIIGTSACTNIAGTKHMADNTKNFAQNEQTGNHCWCRMSGPEQSAWVYYGPRGGDNDPKCERQCALGCMSGLRDDTEMRRAMFTTVKLNSGNANTVADGSLAKNLDNEFKPCEFDWPNDAKGKATWGGHKTQKPEFFHQPSLYKLYEWLANDARKSGLSNANELAKSYENNIKEYKNRSAEPTHYAENATGLKNDEWVLGGFEWMKSESFQCKYPNVTKIKGVATCNSEKGTYGRATNKSFKSNETTGFNCWCKMAYPEQSKWVYLGSFDTHTNPILGPEKTLVINTHTINGEVVEQKAHFENRQISQEEKNLRIKADISYCDSECLQWCGNEYDVEMYEAMFKSIGKK